MSPTDTSIISPFLRLPGEIREYIYYHVLCSVDDQRQQTDGYKNYKYDLKLLLVNRQIYYEARTVFRRNNIFVSIETPWPEAQQHVAVEGFVPLLITSDRAERFTNYHLAVSINTHEYRSFPRQPRRFIILLDDLVTFCEMWFYSELTYPGLNNHLCLTLRLQDPYALSFEDHFIPKALQKRLLEPFGVVKRLFEVHVQGPHYDSLEKAMREKMAEPYLTPSQCLEAATRLKDEGNAALQKNEYQAAIHLYEQSFLAIHIVVCGRRRSIWADAYFQNQITTGPFAGQHAQIVRIMLRVRLVANIILAYLKLSNYEEARFWGTRTINLFRRTIDAEVGEAGERDDEAVLGFPAAKEMGKIYYRTGIAMRELGERQKAKRLIKTAVKYLPGDATVKKDLDTLMLELAMKD